MISQVKTQNKGNENLVSEYQSINLSKHQDTFIICKLVLKRYLDYQLTSFDRFDTKCTKMYHDI